MELGDELKAMEAHFMEKLEQAYQETRLFRLRAERAESIVRDVKELTQAHGMTPMEYQLRLRVILK